MADQTYTDPSQPMDLELQNQDILRKRALSQALAQRAMTPQQGQMVSGHFVAPGLLAALAPLGQAALSGYTNKQADTEQQAYGKNYSSQLSSQLSDYLNKAGGNPAYSLPADQAGPQAAAGQTTPADPRGALVQALSSRLPQMQAVGQAGLAQLMKGPTVEKVGAGDSLYTVDPRTGTSKKVVQGVEKPMVVEGQLVQPQPDGTVKTLGDYRDRYGDVGPVGVDAEGHPILGQKTLTTNKASYVPKGVAVNVNTNDTANDAFSKAIGKGAITKLDASSTSAQAASKALSALGEAQRDLDAGIKTGSTANISLGLSKVGKALGIPGSDDPSIANSEAFRANMARETLNLVKSLGSGSGISNADRDFAEKASGGSLVLDNNSIQRLLSIAQAAAANTLMSHKSMVDATSAAYPEMGEKIQASYGVPISFTNAPGIDWDPSLKQFTTVGGAAPVSKTPTPGSSPAAPMSFDDYIKLHGGK